MGPLLGLGLSPLKSLGAQNLKPFFKQPKAPLLEPLLWDHDLAALVGLWLGHPQHLSVCLKGA